MIYDFEMIYLCEHCIGAIRSRGEKVFVGEEYSDFELEEDSKCECCLNFHQGSCVKRNAQDFVRNAVKT